MLKVGTITDEISQDFSHALDVMDELGLKYVEIQSLWDKYVGGLTDKEVQKVKDLIVKKNMEVSCISPHLFFRVPLRAKPDERSYWGSYSEHIEDLRRCIEIAKKLGTNLVRTFSFGSELLLTDIFGDVWGMLLEKFKEPLEIAEKEGIVLAMETCFLNNIGSAALARKFIDDLGSENLRVLWDPCNTLYLNEVPYPIGYELIKDYIIHVHVKDGVVDLPRLIFNFCPPGEGQVKTYPEILRVLKKDGYQGVFSLESEYVPEKGTKEDGTRKSFASFKKIMEKP